MFSYDFTPKDNNIFENNKQPKLLRLCHNFNNPGWVYNYHLHKNATEIVYIADGKAEYTVDMNTFTLEKGQILIMEKGVLHSITSDKDYPADAWTCIIGNYKITYNTEDVRLLPNKTFHILDAGIHEDFIKNTHKILKTNTSDSKLSWFNVGEYKARKNMVGDMETTPPEKVKIEISKLLNEYLKKQIITLDDILDFHVRFERIHPFQDGNGRVGRIIMFKECLKYNIVPFIIEDNLKMFYYRGLKEWNNEKGYLKDTCLTAQDRYKAYLDYFEIKY